MKTDWGRGIAGGLLALWLAGMIGFAASQQPLVLTGALAFWIILGALGDGFMIAVMVFMPTRHPDAPAVGSAP